MADVINLRKIRKNLARAEREKEAEQNRILHGRPKVERQIAKARVEKAARDLDAHRRNDGDAG